MLNLNVKKKDKHVLPVGIDKIAFYTSHYVLNLMDLAKERGHEADKFFVGFGQQSMSVPSPDEDIVTMAANAASRVMRDVDPNSIEMLLFATESGIDQSKAAGIYVHDLLGLPERCRVMEVKQACYAATMALQLAIPFIRQHPEKKVLVIASDIARYGLNTPGESSQGCGAVAMIISVNPRLMVLESEYGVVTENAMDFWRPNYKDAAFVEGKYSSKLYISMLEKSWQQYNAISKRSFNDHDYYCYHVSVPRLIEKAHAYLAKINGQEKLSDEAIAQQIGASLEYGRKIGNCYTASLYLGLASLMDCTREDLSEKRIGLYSYGSGCVAEYFSGIIQPGYQKMLDTNYQQRMLAERTQLTCPEYESYYTYKYPEDGSTLEIPQHHTGNFRLARIKDHKRIYERVS